MVTPESAEWLSLYGHYKAGFLVCSGGLIDQPNAYLEAMALIEQWVQRDGAGS